MLVYIGRLPGYTKADESSLYSMSSLKACITEQI